MSRGDARCQLSPSLPLSLCVCAPRVPVCVVSSPSPSWTSADPSVKAAAYSAVPTAGQQPARSSLPASSDGCRLGSNQHQCSVIFQHSSHTADCLFPPPPPPPPPQSRGYEARIVSVIGGWSELFFGVVKRCWRRSVTSRLAENHARAAAPFSRRHLETTRAARPSDRCERGHAPWMILGSSGGGGCRWALVWNTSCRRSTLCPPTAFLSRKYIRSVKECGIGTVR